MSLHNVVMVVRSQIFLFTEVSDVIRDKIMRCHSEAGWPAPRDEDVVWLLDQLVTPSTMRVTRLSGPTQLAGPVTVVCCDPALMTREKHG